MPQFKASKVRNAKGMEKLMPTAKVRCWTSLKTLPIVSPSASISMSIYSPTTAYWKQRPGRYQV